MDMNTFHNELKIIEKKLKTDYKKQYKYNTKTIEEEIAKISYDLDQLVQVIGCIADGYTELYKLLLKKKGEFGV
jgi:predicted component of viral defense system (DUF524 family)